MVKLQQVPHLVFGVGALEEARAWLSARGFKRAMVVTSPSNAVAASRLVDGALASFVDESTKAEPTVVHFEGLLQRAVEYRPDVVIGLGGGSPLDAAKLVAALCGGTQTLGEAFGIGNLRARALPLVCVPTTAGTGSEVSPNAILLDEAEQMKKAVISPWLVPDATFVDPALMVTVPPAVTAATGLDALTHCIEAYANKFAHPLVDTWALDGVRLIARSLVRAVQDGSDIAARTDVALGSLYGGLCLGPVNTAAVHALSYPLGSRYHVAHGHANAILLPHVLRFNLPAAAPRYADVAVAMGASRGVSAEGTAEAGIERLWELIEATGLEMDLNALRIPESVVPELAAAGLGVVRLMKNNPRAMTQADAEEIYRAAFRGRVK